MEKLIETALVLFIIRECVYSVCLVISSVLKVMGKSTDKKD